MTTRLVTAIVVALTVQGGATVFTPFSERAYQLVNGIAFAPDDESMYFALLNRGVLAHRGRPDPAAPNTGLFVSTRTESGWGEPSRLPFSGAFDDYEPALAPDGSFLIFNSKRPYAGGRMPARNDLWVVLRAGDGWGPPRPLASINSFDLEESYATVDRERRVIYVRGPAREGGDDYDLYETTLRDDWTTTEPRRLPWSDGRFGEGDPQVAPDGSFVIFTRWDHRVGWQDTCDLHIAFRTPDGWSEPRPLAILNTSEPDYAASLSADGRWLYYRAGSRYLRRPLAPVVEAARD
jgi:hypothetical protein